MINFVVPFCGWDSLLHESMQLKTWLFGTKLKCLGKAANELQFKKPEAQTSPCLGLAMYSNVAIIEMNSSFSQIANSLKLNGLKRAVAQRPLYFVVFSHFGVLKLFYLKDFGNENIFFGGGEKTHVQRFHRTFIMFMIWMVTPVPIEHHVHFLQNDQHDSAKE